MFIKKIRRRRKKKEKKIQWLNKNYLHENIIQI